MIGQEYMDGIVYSYKSLSISCTSTLAIGGCACYSGLNYEDGFLVLFLFGGDSETISYASTTELISSKLLFIYADLIKASKLDEVV